MKCLWRRWWRRILIRTCPLRSYGSDSSYVLGGLGSWLCTYTCGQFIGAVLKIYLSQLMQVAILMKCRDLVSRLETDERIHQYFGCEFLHFHSRKFLTLPLLAIVVGRETILCGWHLWCSLPGCPYESLVFHAQLVWFNFLTRLCRHSVSLAYRCDVLPEWMKRLTLASFRVANVSDLLSFQFLLDTNTRLVTSQETKSNMILSQKFLILIFLNNSSAMKSVLTVAVSI